MIDAFVADGDLVLLEPVAQPENGDMVAAVALERRRGHAEAVLPGGRHGQATARERDDGSHRTAGGPGGGARASRRGVSHALARGRGSTPPARPRHSANCRAGRATPPLVAPALPPVAQARTRERGARCPSRRSTRCRSRRTRPARRRRMARRL